jgi:hypothetical protein
VLGAGFTNGNSTFEQRIALIGGTSSCHMAVSPEPRYITGMRLLLNAQKYFIFRCFSFSFAMLVFFADEFKIEKNYHFRPKIRSV